MLDMCHFSLQFPVCVDLPHEIPINYIQVCRCDVTNCGKRGINTSHCRWWNLILTVNIFNILILTGYVRLQQSTHEGFTFTIQHLSGFQGLLIFCLFAKSDVCNKISNACFLCLLYVETSILLAGTSGFIAER